MYFISSLYLGRGGGNTREENATNASRPWKAIQLYNYSSIQRAGSVAGSPAQPRMQPHGRGFCFCQSIYPSLTDRTRYGTMYIG